MREAEFWRKHKFWGDIIERFAAAPNAHTLNAGWNSKGWLWNASDAESVQRGPQWKVDSADENTLELFKSLAARGAQALGHADPNSRVAFWLDQIRLRGINCSGEQSFQYPAPFLSVNGEGWELISDLRQASITLAQRIQDDLVAEYAEQKNRDPGDLEKQAAAGDLSYQAFSSTLSIGARDKDLEARYRAEGELPVCVIAESMLADFRELGEVTLEGLKDPGDLKGALKSLKFAANTNLNRLAALNANQALQEQFRAEWNHWEAEIQRQASTQTAEIAQEKKRADALAEILRQLKKECGITSTQLAKETGFSLRMVGRHLAHKNPTTPTDANLEVYDVMFSRRRKRPVRVQDLLTQALSQ